MLDDCLTIFQRQADIDKMVLDSYIPPDGTYIIVKDKNGEFELPDAPYEIKLDKKTKNPSISNNPEQLKISRFDYYCRLIDMNKPVDSKKVIQSNNYLSFFIKKESLTNGKLTEECIDNYYQLLRNPNLKYTKKQDKILYESVEKEIGAVDQEKVEQIHQWIKENIFSLPFAIKGKDYLKLFFVFDEDFNVSCKRFETEGKRYYIPNIYNKNDYNKEIHNTIYGLPNNNMGLNAKKPYLEHKDRKSKPPIMEDTQRIMLKKKFFDYLMNQAALGNYNIFFPSEEGKKIKAVDGKAMPENFSGYFLRIRKDKNEAAILDFDTVSLSSDKLKKHPFNMQNILEIPDKDCEGVFYGHISDMERVMNSINEIFFSKYLLGNLFNEPNEITADTSIKKSILLYRDAYKNWFFKGYTESMEKVIANTADILMKNAIENNRYKKVQHQFNLKWSFIEYFQGGEGKMADILKKKRDSIQQKINTELSEYVSISDDDEYCYAVGQVLNFFLSRNKSNKKTYSMANPVFNIHDDKQLKEKLKGMFLKYNYDINMPSKRFGKLYGMICSYEVEQELKQDIMIAGFISPNLIYEKEDN